MIEIKNLHKKYDGLTVVDNLSLSINTGEVLGFLGPNGAGKSTTMKMVTGFISPTSGEIKVKGLSVKDHVYEIKKHIGYLPEGAPQYGEMTAYDFLLFIANSFNVSTKPLILLSASTQLLNEPCPGKTTLSEYLILSKSEVTSILTLSLATSLKEFITELILPEL